MYNFANKNYLCILHFKINYKCNCLIISAVHCTSWTLFKDICFTVLIVQCWYCSKLTKIIKKKPDRGLEPLTVGLKVQRSTD